MAPISYKLKKKIASANVDMNYKCIKSKFCHESVYNGCCFVWNMQNCDDYDSSSTTLEELFASQINKVN